MSYIQGLVSTKNIFKKTQVNEAVYRCVMGGKFVRVTITLFCGRVFLTKSIICPSRFWETHSWRTLLETLFHKKGVWSLWRVEICYILIPVPRPPPHECNVGSEISLRISNPGLIIFGGHFQQCMTITDIRITPFHDHCCNDTISQTPSSFGCSTRTGCPGITHALLDGTLNLTQSINAVSKYEHSSHWPDCGFTSSVISNYLPG